MGKIKFSNGVTMSFEGQPTQADIEEMSQVAMRQGGGAKPINQEPDSIKTKGLSYIKEHPFKSIFNDPVETATGKSLLQRSQETPIRRMSIGKFEEPNWSYIPRATVEGTIQDAGAMLAGGFASPASLATMGVGAIPSMAKTATGQVVKSTVGKEVGKAIAKTKIGQTVGKVLNTELKQIPGKVGEVINKPINYVKEAFIGGDKAKMAGDEAKFALRQSTAQQARNIAKTAKIKTDIVKSNQVAVSKGYDELEETMKKMVSKEADKQGLNLQKDLPKLFGKKSEEYGVARDALIKGKELSVPAKDSVGILEDALEQHGVLRKEGGKLIVARAPMTPAEHEVFGLWSNTRSTLSDNPGAVVMVEDLMRTQRFTQPEFGRAWTPDDKLKSLVSKGLDAQLKKSIPGYKELQAKHAPFLKWKESSINKLEPFNSEFDVQKGVLSKLGSKDITESEQRLMAKLNDVLGKQVGGKIKTLNKGISSIPDKKALSEQASAEVIKKMRSDAAEEIFKLRQIKNVKIHDIDQSVAKLVHKYQTRKIKLYIAGGAISLSAGAVGANSLKYFLTREIYSGVHGN